MSYLKVITISAFAGAVLYVIVVNSIADSELDAYTYETISSALDFHDQYPEYDEYDQWKGGAISFCQGKNKVASDGVSDRISFCQDVPMSIASQKASR